MSTVNVFERASREKFRFESNIGNLTVENLWGLPLRGRANNPDLDSIARGLSNELKNYEESFVSAKSDSAKDLIEAKLELVKYIIADKLAEQDKAKKSAENAETKRMLLGILATKKESELQNKSVEEIELMISKLS